MRALPDRVAADCCGLDVSSNNAAFVGTSGLDGGPNRSSGRGSAAWRAAMEVNLTSVFELTQSAAPFLRDGGRQHRQYRLHLRPGRTGREPVRRHRHGQPGSLCCERGAHSADPLAATTSGPDIRVNAISRVGIARGQPQGFVEKYEARTPLKRMAREDDFRGAALFSPGRCRHT